MREACFSRAARACDFLAQAFGSLLLVLSISVAPMVCKISSFAVSSGIPA